MARWALAIGIYIAAALVGLVVVNGDQNDVGALYGLVAAASLAVGWITMNPFAALIAVVLIPLAFPFGDTNQFTGGDDTDSVSLLASIAAVESAIVFPALPFTMNLEAKIYPWGRDHKRSMRDSSLRDRMWGFTMQGEDLPQATNRVDLDPTVRDVRGFPVARTTYRPHRFEQAASAHYAPVLQAVLQEMGAEWTIVTTSPEPEATGSYGDFISPIPNSKHVMGTVRMGDDPTTSVVDRWGRFHDVPNLMVADSSVFVTSAGYGPTLTLVTLALRNARALVEAS